MPEQEHLFVLRRIAEVLDVPVSTFFDKSESLPAGGSAQLAKEASEILGAFARISDPRTRLACIAFVQAAAAREAGKTETNE